MGYAAWTCSEVGGLGPNPGGYWKQWLSRPDFLYSFALGNASADNYVHLCIKPFPRVVLVG